MGTMASPGVPRALRSGIERIMAKNANRCWPGYEPVPGKRQHEQGSCRPKAKSKLKSSEAEFRKKRREQLDRWEKAHPHTRKSAAQALRKPPTKRKTAKKSAASTPVRSSRSKRRANAARA